MSEKTFRHIFCGSSLPNTTLVQNEYNNPILFLKCNIVVKSHITYNMLL